MLEELGMDAGSLQSGEVGIAPAARRYMLET
jgi:hypothetical protein